MASFDLSVLLVEDRPAAAGTLVDALAAAQPSWQVTTVTSLADALGVLATGTVDCVLADLGLGDGSGTDALVALGEAVPRTVPIIAVAGDDGPVDELEAVRLGAQDCLFESELDPAVVVRSISYAVERAQIRDALARREARYATLIDSLDEGILVQDEQGRVLEANPAAARILGLDLRDLLRDPPVAPRYRAVGADGEQLPLGASPGRLAMQTGEAQLGLVIGVPARSGETTWLEVNAVPIDEGGRGGRAIVSSFRDITERRRLERVAQAKHEQLVEAERLAARRAVERNAAEATNRAKTEFLSRMSHELRTPLNAVLGFVQILQMAGLPDPHRTNVEHIRDAGEHLLALINDVLDIARIEAGQLRLSLDEVDVADAVASSIHLIDLQASARDITIIDRSAGRPVRVVADRRRLQQVLLNLLSNAVKYNRDGGTVTVEAESSGGTVAISVTDSGIGIAEADLDRLFTPFERLVAEGSNIEGTGVGLALSRALSQQMGGNLTAFSVANRGSTFTVELQAAAPAEPAGATEAAAPARAGRPSPLARPVTVLAIEDNPANVQVLDAALGLLDGATLVAATTGQAGLDLATDVRPDLILLDLHLPDLPGDLVVRRLQASPTTASIPVYICSADASTTRRRDLVDRGAAGYLAKPIELGELYAIVAAVAARA